MARWDILNSNYLQMKNRWIRDKFTWLPAITYIILLVLVILQVNWIFKVAKLEEQNFNHKVSMALKQARDEIGTRLPKCDHMSDFLCGRFCDENIHAEKTHEVDSIINSSLSMWHIELPYKFQITDSFLHGKSHSSFKQSLYHQNLNGLLTQEGIMIEVEFPTRNQFLRGQISGLLGLSILFILFVFYSFITLMRLFNRNKATLVQTTDFINNMVHEFQTPIANVRFAVNLIRKNKTLKENPKEFEYTRVILDETLRLQRLVEEILKEGIHDSDNFLVEEIDVHQVINQTVDKFCHRVDNLGGKITLNLDAIKYLVLGDRSAMALAISNLVDNAFKYVATTPLIEICTFNKSGQLFVTINDNGIGIPKEEHKHIFGKYYRVTTGDLHNVKGFGLGLTLVQKVIHRMGGKISVESIPGKGSSFLIVLPLI